MNIGGERDGMRPGHLPSLLLVDVCHPALPFSKTTVNIPLESKTYRKGRTLEAALDVNFKKRKVSCVCVENKINKI